MRSPFFAPVLFFISIIIFIQTADQLGFLNTSVMPTPLMIFQSYIVEFDAYAKAFSETMSAALIGFFLAAFGGGFFALLFSCFRTLKEAILPFAVFFQTVPVIAIAPLIVIYLGFGLPTVVFCSAAVAFFPILANTLIGLESVPRAQIELFQLYRASKWKKFWMLRVPSAYTAIFSGLKVSAGLSIIGVVAGEFVAGGGLGALIDVARTQQRLDIVYGALFLLALIGLIFITLVDLVDLLFRTWRPLSLRTKDKT